MEETVTSNAEARIDAGATALYRRVSEQAASFDVPISPEELAELAVRLDMGKNELAALEAVFTYLADKHHDQVIETLLKLSRLPQKAPKTFEGFDFDRIRGRDAAALRKLPALSNLHARKNLAFIGPGGIGKTHLAQAYGRACCLEGFKTYYLKATELRDKLKKAADSGSTSRIVATLVKPSCLIVDEVGRCTFDKPCTDLFFDIVDRRYEKDCANTMILTSNTPTNNWDEFFTGDDTLLCTLDRLFDRASVFVMKGASFRGAELEIFSVESSPMAIKTNK
jgi:DNA replication protein DnaC